MIPNLQDAWEVEGLEMYEPFTATVAPQVDNETTQQTPNLCNIFVKANIFRKYKPSSTNVSVRASWYFQTLKYPFEIPF